MTLRPGTPMGQWSVGLLLAFVAGLGGLMLAIAAGQKGGDTFSDNWWLAGPGLTAAASGIAALATGLVALVRERDRAASVLLATLVGLLVTLFVAAEIVFPH